MKIQKSVVKHIPEILSGFAAVGVIGTAILSSKASVESADIWTDESKTVGEKIKLVWKNYIPAALSGSATVGALIFSVATGRKQTVAVTGACTLVATSYQRYRDKVKEIFGEDANRRIVEELGGEIANPEELFTVGLVETSSLDLKDVKEKEYIFYDRYSDRYFVSKLNKVLQAEYHLNRNYMLRGDACINEFYNFLGLAQIEGGDAVGWTMADEIYWIDFDHYPATMKDGTRYFVIDLVFDPVTGYEDR